MTLEEQQSYPVRIEMAHVNEQLLLKPASYQILFAQAAEAQLEFLNLSMEEIKLNHHMGWVIVSLSAEVVRPLNGATVLTARTWHSVLKGPYYRREFSFSNQQGEELFHGSSFSVLLDFETGRICRPKNVPFTVGTPGGPLTMEASPTMREEHPYGDSVRRRAENSWIDCFGHVNNCRYSEFAYDMLTAQEVAQWDHFNRMDLYFHHQLTAGEEFDTARYREGNRLWVRGTKSVGGEKSFDVLFTFAE